MKWSKYNHYWKVDNKQYIYNSLANTVMFTETEIDKENQNDLDKFVSNNEMIEYGYIVPSNENENNKALYQMNKQKFNNESIAFWIYTTLKCNFSCTYCFESHLKQEKQIDMLNDTVPKVVEWIFSQVKARNSQTINITFFGGEPLLNMNVINYFIQEMDRKYFSSSVKYNIVTNGFDLDEHVLKKLVGLGVNTYQITLDGAAPVHDKRRTLKDGTGTFKRIIENVIFAVKGFGDELSILIRINVDESTVESAKSLLKLLKRLGLAPFLGIAVGQDLCANTFHSKKSISTIIDLYKTALNLGYKVSFSELSPCWMTSDRFFLISPAGEVYKCPMMMGDEEFIVSSVNDDILRPRYYDLLSQSIPVDCLDCNMIGLCFGGCKFQRIGLNHASDRKSCDKGFIKRMIELKCFQAYVNETKEQLNI